MFVVSALASGALGSMFLVAITNVPITVAIAVAIAVAITVTTTVTTTRSMTTTTTTFCAGRDGEEKYA